MDMNEEQKIFSEDLQRQREKMEVVGRLAGGVAHDFNNILTAMLLNLEDAIENQPHLQNELEELHSLATQGAKLTRQLLEFSRQQPMALVPININAEIVKFMKMIRRMIGDTIKVVFKQEAGDPWVEADVTMIDQALMNIMINARDAMPYGGTLTVSTSVCYVEGPSEDSKHAREGIFFQIRIEDSGEGMPQEVIDHLFEPFYTTKQIGKGTGLGLASADGSIHQHGGWIEVKSQVGKGSAFIIYLPITENRPMQGVVAPLVKRSNRETILLVEDNACVRRITTRLLERLGYTVLAVADGWEALGLWREASSRINLLLTDMMMPNGMSGLELGNRLRIDNPRLKIIMVSGYSEDIVREQGIDLPNIRFLSKPFEGDVLARLVRQVLDSSTSTTRLPLLNTVEPKRSANGR